MVFGIVRSTKGGPEKPVPARFERPDHLDILARSTEDVAVLLPA